MNCRKNAEVVIVENSQMAVTSTKFWNFLPIKNFVYASYCLPKNSTVYKSAVIQMASKKNNKTLLFQ